MNESSTKTTSHFTSCASLAAIGVKLRQLDLFGPVHKTVQIAQKTVKHTPVDKLYDAFISLLALAQGLVEINTRLRSDAARPRGIRMESLCRAVGRPRDAGCLHCCNCEANGASCGYDLSAA